MLAFSGLAQPLGKVPRVCFITFDPPASRDGRHAPFFRRLQDLGYIDGQSISINILSAQERDDAFSELAAECVRRHADVIVATSTPAARAAKRATPTIPIVMSSLGDPVATGLVTNLSRPEANVTGTAIMAPLVAAKRLELLKEAVPSLTRVLVLTYLIDPVARGQIKALEEAARLLRLELIVQDVRSSDDFRSGIAEGKRLGAEGLLTTNESVFAVNSAALVELSHTHEMPAAFLNADSVRRGGFLSFQADIEASRARSADLVDRILKGTPPGDLPVEQPSRFVVAVNLQTAKKLNIDVPPAILARADELID